MTFDECVPLCNHHHNQDIVEFHHLPSFVANSPLHPQLLATTNPLCVSMVLSLFLLYHLDYLRKILFSCCGSSLGLHKVDNKG